MIEHGGTIYYFDFDALDKCISYNKSGEDKPNGYEKKVFRDADGNVTGSEEIEVRNNIGKEIDGPKYDMFRLMIDIIIDYNNDEESDMTLGADRAMEKMPLSYKMAFNTLYNHGIIREK
jgi:hypothetical protein